MSGKQTSMTDFFSVRRNGIPNEHLKKQIRAREHDSHAKDATGYKTVGDLGIRSMSVACVTQLSYFVLATRRTGATIQVFIRCFMIGSASGLLKCRKKMGPLICL